MRKLSIGRILYRFRRSSSGLGLISNFSFSNNNKKQVSSSSTLDEIVEYKPLIASTSGHLVNKLKDVTSGGPLTLALHSKPKEVVLKVSMHCNGCARQVKKHVLKMEGVISCKVDMETKTVVVTGDIIPLQVLESLSKVKTAQLWYDTQTDSLNPN